MKLTKEYQHEPWIMTDKRLLIAVHNGWRWEPSPTRTGRAGVRGILVNPRLASSGVTVWKDGMLGNAAALPDYLSDLNAMARAVNKLNVNQLSLYLDALDKLCVPVHICPLSHQLAVVEATAAQRADAFLVAVGALKLADLVAATQAATQAEQDAFNKSLPGALLDAALDEAYGSHLADSAGDAPGRHFGPA
jgi:hypothetical protein